MRIRSSARANIIVCISMLRIQFTMRFPMSARLRISSLALLLPLAIAPFAIAQSDEASPVSAPVNATSASTTVPHFIKYSGTLPSASTSAVNLRFSLFAAQTGGDPIWSEVQSVTPTGQGKYTVLLGSTTSTGLPQPLFTTGAAKWLSVAPSVQDADSDSDSSAASRTLLIATPYALKASDSDTLAGHPISDFSLLSSAKPLDGTDITQINVGAGLTGGGTGPTVSIGLSETYLQSLGNNVYAQLAAANSFRGNQSISGTLTVNGSPVVGSLVAQNGLEVTHSGNAYTITTGPALITIANQYFAQLAASNTFTKAQTFLAPVTFASGQSFSGVASLTAANTFTKAQTINSTLTVNGQTTVTAALSSSFGLQGINSGTSSGGVFGEAGAIGVQGKALNTASSQSSIGVSGETGSASGTGVEGLAPSGSTASGVLGGIGPASAVGGTVIGLGYGAGVWGDAANNSGGYGVLGTTDAGGDGGFFANNDGTGNFPSLLTFNYSNQQNSLVFAAYNTVTNTSCDIDVYADFGCDGQIGAVVTTPDNHKVETYSVQSSESWIEDYGSGQLANGRATIAIEPGFQQTVNTGVDYHVFLTPNGDSKGHLYVTSKGAGSFEVRESNGGSSNIAFDYRIVAKRRGSESVRLKDVTEQRKQQAQHFAAKPNARPEGREPSPLPRPQVVAAQQPLAK
jgi:hypothetical protein